MTDIWKWFATFCLVGATLLIVVPQAWIVAASFRQAGGQFTLHRDADRLEVVRADLKRFGPVAETTGAARLLRDEDELTLTVLPNQRLSIDLEGTPFVESLGTNRLRIVNGGFDFRVEQQAVRRIHLGAFAQSTDGSRKTVQPLVAKVVPGGVVISHAETAYLTFVDGRTNWSIQNFRGFLSTSHYMEAVRNSIVITVAATSVATLLAVPLAWLLARYTFPYRTLVVTMVTMASVSPPFLGAYSWRMLLGSSGIITNVLGMEWSILGLHGVIWVVVWLIYPLIFLTTLDSFSGLDPTLRESAQSLGASRLRAFLNVEIPSCLPGIITGAYLAALTAFSDFGTPFIISLDLTVLPTLIYSEFLSEVGGDPSVASTASVVMLALATGLLTLQRLLLVARSFASVTSRQSFLERPSVPVRTLAAFLSVLMLGMAFVPHVTVGVTSFLEWRVGTVTGNFTLQNYAGMFRTELASIFVSLSTAGAATALSLLFGTSIAYIIVRKRYRILSPALNAVVMLPLIIPGTVFAIGYILVFNDGPIILTGTWLILTLAYFIRKLPFAVKTSEAVLYQIHPAMEEAAVSLGATPDKVFRQIVVPMMVAGAVTGSTLVFLRSVTELSATILLFRPPWRPMSAVIFEQTISPGSNFGVAAALSVLMMAILYVPLFLLTRRRQKLEVAQL
ncbi:MAG: iron ABC transporter permease [Rhodobacter sp.]|nr:iron ABC transporter permease [Rhodobacter sp.]MCY4168801.1 iron ABC transporter permease [Rhodobacter sp.]MCY4241511.1 iron ABC transporter permease [Rhodobacter sp.]